MIWSPASSAWGAVLNQRLSEAGEPEMAPAGTPFMLSPLVIAMPQPMAEALGYPEESVGWADILQLSQDPEGWGAFGHPEWGPFRLGKTNPNFSTSGLSALIAQYYAATGRTSGLTIEDVQDPAVLEFASNIEQAVVHYGDTTLTFLNNLYRNDQRGTALTYASAVAIEEVSLINYNRGNPDGVLQAGEQEVPPRIPLVAIYPEEGTLFSDNPFFILEAEWVDDDESAAAEIFTEFVQRPENQERVLEFGFRPGNIEVPIGDPITAEFNVDPDQPQTTLEVPEPEVLLALLDAWRETRKTARVLLVIDVSGSMADFAGPGSSATKLDLAKVAAANALDQFKDDDQVGLRIFSTDLSTTEPFDYVDVVGIGPMSETREQIRTAIEGLFPVAGTPLYTVAEDSFTHVLEGFDETRINAVVLLTDGMNDDPRNDDLQGLLDTLSEQSQGENAQPVRIFTIAYGQDADVAVLEQIAQATNGAAYDSVDATSIDRVFTNVISNF